MLRKLATALAICCIATCAAAQSTAYRFLKLDGYFVRWPLPKSGPLVLTYKVVTNPVHTQGARNCSGITSFDGLAEKSKLSVDAIKATAVEAFRMWEASSNVKFVESRSDSADILLGAQIVPDGWAFAEVLFNPKSIEEFKPITKGLVCFNPNKTWKIGFGAKEDLTTYDMLYTFAHEIGHALGLDHPEGIHTQIMGFRYHEKFRSIQPGDALGASMLYGKPLTRFVGKAE